MPSRAPAPLEPAPRGRPRSERARRAILKAASTLFEEGGYAAATIEAIAARSRVAKTTIYRWWPNRAALMVELLLRIAEEVAPPPEGPDPVEALRTELGMVAAVADSLAGQLMRSLIGESQRDPEVREALLQGLYGPRRRASADVIRQAQRMGLFRKDVEPGVATDLLFGPTFYRGFVRQEPVPPSFVRQVFELVLIGLATGGRVSREGARPAGRRAGRRRAAPAGGPRPPAPAGRSRRRDRDSRSPRPR